MARKRSFLSTWYLGDPKHLTRHELISILENRKVKLTGGKWVRGTNFHLPNFDKEHLIQLIEGSKPLTPTDRRMLDHGAHFLTAA